VLRIEDDIRLFRKGKRGPFRHVPPELPPAILKNSAFFHARSDLYVESSCQFVFNFA
jgi:hypothetical protein